MLLPYPYADESNNENSDFDALIISEKHGMVHDTTFVDEVQLDVFVYPASCFEGGIDCREFLQVFDGKVLLDTTSRKG